MYTPPVGLFFGDGLYWVVPSFCTETCFGWTPTAHHWRSAAPGLPYMAIDLLQLAEVISPISKWDVEPTKQVLRLWLPFATPKKPVLDKTQMSFLRQSLSEHPK